MNVLLLPLRRPKKVRVDRRRRHVSLGRPVVLDGDIYTGDCDGELVKLDHKLNPVWRMPAERWDLRGTAGGMILLGHFDEWTCRAIEPSGKTAWIRRNTYHWMPWRDRVLIGAPKLILVDAATGVGDEVIDEGPLEGGTLADVFMFRRVGEERVECAFDLIQRRLLWRRNLYDELERRFGLRGYKKPLWEGGPEHAETIGRAPGGPARFIGLYADHIIGFSMEDGSPIWAVPGNIARYFPLVKDGRVYAWTCDKAANYAAHLVCLDEDTGEVIYDRAIASEFFYYGTLPWPGTLAGEYAVFPVRTRVLALFRLSDGEQVWSYEYPHKLYEPVVADNRLLVTSSDGNLLVFDGSPEKSRIPSR